MYPIEFDVNSGIISNSKLSLGSDADSFIEYLLKGWIIGGKTNANMRKEYDLSVDAYLTYLAKPVDGNHIISTSSRIYFASGFPPSPVHPVLEHLTCFAGGMLALGAVTKLSPYSNRVFELAQGFSEVCVDLYLKQDMQLSPDRVSIPSFEPLPGYENYNLRPEVIETLFYMWRLTHDQKYRDWAWKIMEIINEQALVHGSGYTGFKSVITGEEDDRQLSFFLAETIKYLYLIFEDDDVVPLETMVFNTEAHPLKAQSPSPPIPADL